MLLRSQRVFVRLLILSLLVVGSALLAVYRLDWGVATVLGLLIAYAMVVVVYYYFSVFRKLAKLVAQVEALLAGERYAKLPVTTRDEYGLLAQFFNQVTTDLEAVSFELSEGDRRASELNLASDIQQSVLPKKIPQIPGLDVVARTRPAEEVGGDSFGFFTNGDQRYIYLGDVTGHGAPAGLIMMMVSTLFAVFVSSVNNSQELMTVTNKVLKPRVNSTMFMTTVILRWDTAQRQLFFTGAGHEHVLVYRAAEGVCEAIVTGGIALGMVDDITDIAEEKQIPLNPSDVVVLYTDGIPEARNFAEEMFELDRLKKSVEAHAGTGSAQAIFSGIAKDLSEFVGEEPQLDDITLIVLRNGEQAADSIDKDGMIVTRW